VRRLAAAGAALVLLLAGCSAADNDRESGSGKAPDKLSDATRVEVFRNADNVPNVARFCADGHGFWSTLSGGDQSGTKPPQLLRATELDVPYCGKAPG
jgi:hypothetical protein